MRAFWGILIAGMVVMLPVQAWACVCREDWPMNGFIQRKRVPHDVSADMVFEGRITQNKERDAASYYIEPQKIYKGTPIAQWYNLSDAMSCNAPRPHIGDTYLFYMSFWQDKNKKSIPYPHACGELKFFTKLQEKNKIDLTTTSQGANDEPITGNTDGRDGSGAAFAGVGMAV